MSFRSKLLGAWQHKNWLSWLLLPLSGIYGLVSWMRQRAYASGLLKSYRAPLPVIVVGNITVGGTGKTPTVIYLIELLRRNGFKPGIVSRGYTSAADQFPLTVSTQTPVELAGDEPALIVKRTAAPMVIGPNRAMAIEQLTNEFDVDTIISDDGLQHLAMQRDIEICILDKTKTSNNDYLLPAGPYREAKQRLQTVDLIVEHHTERVELSAERYPMKLKPLKPEAISNGVWNNPKTAHAVAGIGNPDRFFNTCRAMDLNIIEHVFDDHHAYQFSDIDFSDDLPVLMTEKDAVKCSGFADTRHHYLPVNAILSADFDKKMLRLLKVAIARL